jgi:hypothetical protein
MAGAEGLKIWSGCEAGLVPSQTKYVTNYIIEDPGSTYADFIVRMGTAFQSFVLPHITSSACACTSFSFAADSSRLSGTIMPIRVAQSSRPVSLISSLTISSLLS